jgi:hypothetical protein
MSDQPKSNVLNEENWQDQKCPYTPDFPVLGFLQLCADRRFHREIQELFQRQAGLREPTDYWIHADAGGTPKMEHLRIAPDYCYYDKGVRLMAWAAHGAGCGGFGPNVPDEVIRQELLAVSRRKAAEYPAARHFVYFVTTITEGDQEETVVHSMSYEKDAD